MAVRRCGGEQQAVWAAGFPRSAAALGKSLSGAGVLGPTRGPIPSFQLWRAAAAAMPRPSSSLQLCLSPAQGLLVMRSPL